MVAGIIWKELLRKFRALGYNGPFSGGKHQFIIRGKQKVRIPNSNMSDIGVSLLKEILRQAGISSQDWDRA
jgi:predicted RNA binding protein YcfA (HicA-like mRNA interferase family)